MAFRAQSCFLRLAQLTAWNAVNGEAIFGTRPWQIYGEGAVQATGGLTVSLPGVKPSDFACALRITGTNLKPTADK